MRGGSSAAALPTLGARARSCRTAEKCTKKKKKKKKKKKRKKKEYGA